MSTDPHPSTEEVLKKSQYRFTMMDVLSNLTPKNVKESAQIIGEILSVNTSDRVSTFCRLFCDEVGYRQIRVAHFAELMLEIFGTYDNPKLASGQKDVFKQMGQMVKRSRPMCMVIGILLSKNFYPEQKMDFYYRTIIKKFVVNRPTFFNLLNAITFFLQCKDIIKEKYETVYTWSIQAMSTLLKYFSSPQAKSCYNEFQALISQGEYKPYNIYTILANDEADRLSEFMSPKAEFFPSIFDTNDLTIFCPSVLSAAAFFKANKCVDALLKRGFSVDQQDMHGRSFSWFAGASGNIEAFNMTNPTPEMITIFAEAAIVYRHNDIFLGLGQLDIKLEGLRTPLHMACLCNNAVLAQKLIELGADPFAKDECEDLPQHCAARADSVEALLKIVAVPEFSFDSQNFADKSVLQLAIVYRCCDTVRTLMGDFKVERPDKEEVSFSYGTMGYEFSKVYNKYILNMMDDENEEEEDHQEEEEDYNGYGY